MFTKFKMQARRHYYRKTLPNILGKASVSKSRPGGASRRLGSVLGHLEPSPKIFPKTWQKHPNSFKQNRGLEALQRPGASWTVLGRSWPKALLPENPPKLIQTKSRPGGALRRLGNVPGHLEPSWGDLGYYRKILPKSSNPNAAATRGGAGAKSDQHLPIIHPLDASRLRLRDVLEVYWMRLGMRLEKILGRLETYKKPLKFWSEGTNHDPKILPKSSQNPPEIFPKLSNIVQNPGLETPWGVLATSWCILARLGNILGRLEPILGRLG